MRERFSARDYPGTIAAIVVGLGITGFLLWAARRNGGWRNLQANAAERARQGYGAIKQRRAPQGTAGVRGVIPSSIVAVSSA